MGQILFARRDTRKGECGERPWPNSEILVVVMARDEIQTLTSVVEGILSELVLAEVSHRILIIDDGSLDGTAGVADNLAKQYPQIDTLHLLPTQGLGTVYYYGLKVSQSEWISFFPADGQYPAKVLTQLLTKRLQADLVLGFSPRLFVSDKERFFSSLGGFLYHLLFRELPAFRGVFLAKTELRQLVNLQARGRDFSLVFELILATKAANKKIISIPVEVRPRLSGRSKFFSMKAMWANLIGLLQLKLRLYFASKNAT